MCTDGTCTCDDFFSSFLCFTHAVLERGIMQEEDELENKGHLPAGLRIRKTQHATTLRLLIDAITEFNAEQVDYKEKCEERIQRVVSIGNYFESFLYLFRKRGETCWC